MPQKATLALALLTLFIAPTLMTVHASAQQGPMPPHAMAGDRGHGPADFEDHGGHGGGSLGLPHGMWWKNPETITQLSLTADQQKRMDDIVRKNRIQLIHVKASLEEEQLNLEPLVNAGTFDQAKTLAEVSKIADLRAELEKTDARMLVEMRGVLTADQWTKLHTMGKDRHARPDGGHQAGPPQGQRGPRGPQGAAAPPPPPTDEGQQQ